MPMHIERQWGALMVSRRRTSRESSRLRPAGGSR